VLHVYGVGFDETGRFQIETLWDDENVYLDGLKPGETKVSYLFVPQGKLGIREIRFFSSPKRLSFFLFPPSPDAESVPPHAKTVRPYTLESDDLQRIRMKTIRYSLITIVPIS
jgi:hypothetical protein